MFSVSMVVDWYESSVPAIVQALGGISCTLLDYGKTVLVLLLYIFSFKKKFGGVLRSGGISGNSR